jgi:hypothetical protein
MYISLDKMIEQLTIIRSILNDHGYDTSRVPMIGSVPGSKGFSTEIVQVVMPLLKIDKNRPAGVGIVIWDEKELKNYDR